MTAVIYFAAKYVLHGELFMPQIHVGIAMPHIFIINWASCDWCIVETTAVVFHHGCSEKHVVDDSFRHCIDDTTQPINDLFRWIASRRIWSTPVWGWATLLSTKFIIFIRTAIKTPLVQLSIARNGSVRNVLCQTPFTLRQLPRRMRSPRMAWLQTPAWHTTISFAITLHY